MTIEAGDLAQLNDAIGTLSQRLTATSNTAASSHDALTINGLSEADVKDALATYLVGLQLTAIDQAGRISTHLIGETPADAHQIVRDIEYLVVPPQGTEDLSHWKSTFRNAWIAGRTPNSMF